MAPQTKYSSQNRRKLAFLDVQREMAHLFTFQILPFAKLKMNEAKKKSNGSSNLLQLSFISLLIFGLYNKYFPNSLSCLKTKCAENVERWRYCLFVVCWVSTRMKIEVLKNWIFCFILPFVHPELLSHG